MEKEVVVSKKIVVQRWSKGGLLYLRKRIEAAIFKWRRCAKLLIHFLCSTKYLLILRSIMLYSSEVCRKWLLRLGGFSEGCGGKTDFCHHSSISPLIGKTNVVELTWCKSICNQISKKSWKQEFAKSRTKMGIISVAVVQAIKSSRSGIPALGLPRFLFL